MATLPPTTDFTGASVTQGGFKTAFSSLRDFLSDLLGTAGTPAAARTALGIDLQKPIITATTTGTGSAYVLTPSPALTAYADGQCLLVTFHAANTAGATININGLGAAELKVSPGGAALAAVSIKSGALHLVHRIGGAWVLGAPVAVGYISEVLTGTTPATLGDGFSVSLGFASSRLLSVAGFVALADNSQQAMRVESFSASAVNIANIEATSLELELGSSAAGLESRPYRISVSYRPH